MSKLAKELGLIVGGLTLALLSGPIGMWVMGGNLQATQAMIGIGLSSALAGVGLALRQQTNPVATANSIGFNAGVAPRRLLYGKHQTAGVLTYASFPPGQNISTTSQYLHLVYTLTEHEISSFDAVSVNGTLYNFGTDIFKDSSLPDTPWQIHPAQDATSNDFYWQHMMFEFDFGKPQNTAQPFPNLAAADSAWTSACLQRGCAKVHVILRADTGQPALYPSGAIPNIQFLVTGKKLIDPRVITAWQPSTDYPQYTYFVDNNGYIWFQKIAGLIWLLESGTSRPAFESHETPGATLLDNVITWQCTGQILSSQVFTNPTSSTEPTTVANGRLLNDGWGGGVVFPSGAQNENVIESPLGYLQLLTSAGGTSGTTYPNWATSPGATTADGTVTWTCLGPSPHASNPSNPALVVYDYLQDSTAGMNTLASAIDVISVQNAANVCEEQELIIWNEDGTQVYENLYACDGQFDLSTNRGDILLALTMTMAGWVVPPGDLWHVFAGTYVTPSLALGDADLRAAIRGDFRLSHRDVANGVKGTYTPAYLPASPAAAISLASVPGTWQSLSFPPYQANGLAGSPPASVSWKPNYLNTEDGGKVIWADQHFEFTTSLWMAQRLAKIVMMRLRFQQTLTLQLKLTAFALEACDTFTFNHARWGIGTLSYEATQVGLTLETGGKDHAPVVGVDVVARQTDPSVYEFQPPQFAGDIGEYSPYGVTGVMNGVE